MAHDERDEKGRYTRIAGASPTKYSKPFKYNEPSYIMPLGPSKLKKLKAKPLKEMKSKFGPHYPSRYEVGQGGSKGLARMKRSKNPHSRYPSK